MTSVANAVLVMGFFLLARPSSAWLSNGTPISRRSGWTSFHVSNAAISTTRHNTGTRHLSSGLLEDKGNLVSVQDCLELYRWSEKNSSKVRVVFVDGSWYHGEAANSRNGRAEFEAGPRIPNARYIDMDDIAATKELFPELNPKGLGHMLPPPDLFSLTMDEFDIRHSDHVIVYGRLGTIFLPRTWFLFRCMGHDRVSLMQGSLEEWMERGGPVDTEPTTVTKARTIVQRDQPVVYRAKQPANVVTLEEMREAVPRDDVTIVDPRGSSFAKGHMPGAIQVPYNSLVEKDNQLKLKSVPDLQKILDEAGVDYKDTSRRIIASCGSGVSVCHVLLALNECGRTVNTYMYDGSWAEWGTEPDTPKTSTN